MVDRVGHVNAVGADCDAERPVEVARAAAGAWRCQRATRTRKVTPRGLESPPIVKDLHPVVPRVGDVDIPRCVHGYASGQAELAGRAALDPPLEQPLPFPIEHLHAVVRRIHHIDVARTAQRDPSRRLELGDKAAFGAPCARPVPDSTELHHPATTRIGQVDGPPHIHGHAPWGLQLAPDGHEVSYRVEDLNRIVVGVGHVDVPLRVHRDAAGRAKPSDPDPFHAPLGHEIASPTKDLDAVVEGIGDIDVARAIHRQRPGKPELAVEPARTPPSAEECSGGREHLDPVIAGVRHVDVAVEADGDTPWSLELAVVRAPRPPCGQELSGGPEHPDPVVARIGDVDLPRFAYRDAQGPIELAVATTPGAPFAAPEHLVAVELMHTIGSEIEDIDHARRGHGNAGGEVKELMGDGTTPLGDELESERRRRGRRRRRGYRCGRGGGRRRACGDRRGFWGGRGGRIRRRRRSRRREWGGRGSVHRRNGRCGVHGRLDVRRSRGRIDRCQRCPELGQCGRFCVRRWEAGGRHTGQRGGR